MNYSDIIAFVASAIEPTFPEHAATLMRSVVGVRRMERWADEQANEAAEEERLQQFRLAVEERRHLRVVQ